MTPARLRSALAGLALLACCAAPSAAVAALQAHLLVVDTPDAVRAWLQRPPAGRRGDAGRLRSVAKGQKVFVPILVSGLPAEARRDVLRARWELIGPDGRRVAGADDCCRAGAPDARMPGMAVMNPAPDLVFEAGDPPGHYTVRATVSDGVQTTTVAETFGVGFVAEPKIPAALPDVVGKAARTASAKPAHPPQRPARDAQACLQFEDDAALRRCAERLR